MSIFTGLSAFPLTPADASGAVNTDALGLLVDRLAGSGVDSISVLGSTGTYAYLDRDQRNRTVAAAVEAAAGRVPIVAGISALRTSWAKDLASAAESAGASGLLLAPISYTKLIDREVRDHFISVASTTGLPLCIYNNPGTTNFNFSETLITELAGVRGIAAIKMPLPVSGDFSSELTRLRAGTPERFAIGYSGDWGAAPSLLAGSDAWYSVVAGLLPNPALRLTRAAQAGREEEAKDIDATFEPLWALFRTHGSLRVMYAIAELLQLPAGDPPLPLMRIDDDVAAALAKLSD